MDTFDLTNGQWGGIYSIATLSSAIVMLWAGALTDQFRARSLTVWCLVILAVFTLWMSQAHKVWMLPFIIFGLRFAGQGLLTHIAVIAMARWFSKARGKAIAISNLGFSFGEAFVPMIFVGLLTTVYWQDLWLMAVVGSVIAIPIILWLLKRERSPLNILAPDDQAGMLGMQWTRKQAVSHWLFWMVVPMAITPGTFCTALFFQQVHLADVKGWDHVALVSLFPIFTGSTILSMMVFGWAIDRYGTPRFMPFFQIPMALGFLVIATSSSTLGAAIGFALIGIMQGANGPLTGAFWAEFYGTKHLGSIKAVATSLMVFGSALGPAVTGIFIDYGVDFDKQMIAIAIYVLCVCFITGLAMRWAAPLRRISAGA